LSSWKIHLGGVKKRSTLGHPYSQAGSKNRGNDLRTPHKGVLGERGIPFGGEKEVKKARAGNELSRQTWGAFACQKLEKWTLWERKG